MRTLPGLLRSTGALALVGLVLAGPIKGQDQVADGLATVQQDGSLALDGRVVRLFGLFIPNDERTCRTVIRPPRCAARAVLALESLVEGFVLCRLVRRLRDGSFEGLCSTRDRDIFAPRNDIGAALVQQGFALARGDAPPEYIALERLAQSREVGLWGDKIVNFR